MTSVTPSHHISLSVCCGHPPTLISLSAPAELVHRICSVIRHTQSYRRTPPYETINDMAGFLGSLWRGKQPQDVSKDAIVGLRQQLQMIEKKEEYTQKKIDEELAKAKASAVTNKAGMSTPTS